MNYVFEHEGKQFTPSGVVNVANTAQHNAAIEAQELAIWDTKPDHHCAYVGASREGSRSVFTWLGTPLGRIVSSSTYRNNLGARITCLTIEGSNGACYHGRYGSDWSELVRLRKSK